jgi:hypothetical protein
MHALHLSLRKQLESAVLAARRASEGGCRASIDGLGVFADRRPEHLDDSQTELRNGLRAKWRQLAGDRELLIAECAYEQWHRLLFARFLAENNLLLHPRYKASVTLADCEELAAELGEPDGWSVAARFASEILPGIFRIDDPCVRLRLAPEGRHALEQILDELPAEMFLADDALGWVYQFWQKDKKDEVNASERKIGGADLGPVTQLFTENYMVRFLLENSLGAWWASRHPDSPLAKDFGYLRFDEGKPAAGSFDGWPDRVADVTVMDPCCGSGHFLVEAFSMLWRMRAEEEGVTSVEAQDAVLRDNLFGLELDSRCVQIAMFAVALQAWKAGVGWRQLPVPNIACSGIPVKAPVGEWKDLARGDARLENVLVRMHILFRDADTLGSLIDPKLAAELTDPMGLQRSFEDVDWDEIAPMVVAAVAREGEDPATAVLGGDAASVARAAAYLSRAYTLVVTNPPFLTSASQSQTLRAFTATRFPKACKELSTSMAERFFGSSTTCAFVLPQHWLHTKAFQEMRHAWLQNMAWHSIARLGAGAFDSISGEVVQVVLWCASMAAGRADHEYFAIDALTARGSDGKAAALIRAELLHLTPLAQLTNPDARILFLHRGDSTFSLAEVADSTHGMNTKDQPRFVLYWWEPDQKSADWEHLQVTTGETMPWSGLSHAVYWQGGHGVLSELQKVGKAILVGSRAYGKPGVLISLTGDLRATLYHGGHFSQNAAAVTPTKPELLPALWAFVSSAGFGPVVRELDVSLKVPPGTLVKVPFDLQRWQKAALEAGPLPTATSGDPTQWVFDGRPENSTAPLQVAVARLMGFRWSGQQNWDDLDSLIDEDGIVCLPSVSGEAPAAERVQQVLAAAFGESWSPPRAKQLIEQAGSKKNLADWLRDDFFKQHCALFANRPLVWHVWDGQRDGFSALVDYHRLDRKMLEKLTYTYLGQDWVERQRAEARDEVAGAEARLSAGLELQRKLEAILVGEKPFDIYVRWKELHEQPVGWNPDLNDGVRLNIRPFVQAGVLRTFSPWAFRDSMWKKDRGKDLDGSERHNDIHLCLAEKLEARKRAGRP